MTFRDLRLRIRALAAPRRVERELKEELAFHVEREAQKLLAEGLTREKALAGAHARFGSIPLAAEQCRDARGSALLETTFRDVREAWRTCRRTPLAALTIVVTIALGLACLTVAFTVYSALFLRGDAVRNPDELVTVERLTRPDLPHAPGSPRAWMLTNGHEFDLLRHDTGVLTDAIAMQADVAARIDGHLAAATLVSGNFFQVLGVHAVRGRTLGADDDAPSSARAVLVLSARALNTLFAGDVSVVGRQVRVNGRLFDVVGVMPEDFRGLRVVAPDFWAPLGLGTELDAGGGRAGDVLIREVVGRLPSRMTLETAEARLTAWASSRTDFRRIVARWPNYVTLTPNRGTFWPASFRGLISPVFIAFGLVLVIGCANVANLLLARGVSRQREVGIRLSLGASRRRVVRQLFTESLVLAFAAAALALVLSRWMLTAAVYTAGRLAPPEQAERMALAAFPLDWRIVLLLGTAALIATALFGLLPALGATRISLVQTMRGDVTKATRPGRARRALVALQVGAASLLLISATLLLRSSLASASRDFGVRMSDTLLLPVTNEPLRQTLLAQVAAHPAVVSFAAVSWGWPATGTYRLVDARSDPNRISYQLVSPQFFDTLGVSILKGRGFRRNEDTPDAGVIVVAERTARALWPNGEALGQVVQFAMEAPARPGSLAAASSAVSRAYTVVGVARNVEAPFDYGLGFYVPTGRDTPGTSLVVRVHGDPDSMRRALLDRLLATDPALGDIRTFRAMASGRAFPLRVAFWVTVAIAGLALALTASGLFGVLSHVVEQRRKEIGIRMALGATTGNVRVLVLSQMVGPVGVGILAGAGLATACMKVLRGWLPAVLGDVEQVFDPAMYAVCLVLIVGVCLIAASAPAHRAAGTDPTETLRLD